jgi:Phospholipid methyltransferase
MDEYIDFLALLVALTGELIRVLTVGLEYIKRGGLNKRVYADRLVIEGMFAHCRNPLYVGNLMIGFALLTILDQVGMFVVGGVMLLLTYFAIVAAEEQYLRATFGKAYEEYCQSTNRWIPDLRGLGDTIAGMQFNWRRVLLKESGSFYGWIVAVFLLSGIENHFSPARPDFAISIAMIALGTVALVTVRVLKQTGQLRL